MPARITTRVIIYHKGKILLTRNQGYDFWYPGGGGQELRKQLYILKSFINSFDFINMEPDNSIIKKGIPQKASCRALVNEGHSYAIYINGGKKADLAVKLPKGIYMAEWVNTKTGKIEKSGAFEHDGGIKLLKSPDYIDDIALSIKNIRKKK